MPRTTNPTKSRCPHCHRRSTLKADYVMFDTFERATVATWQCIYCGAVCERSSGRLVATEVRRVILAPGELEQLRNARMKHERDH